MPYVYSTLTCDNEYTDWIVTGTGEAIKHRVKHSVKIAGGHGLMNKNFITPLGVVTEVSDSDMEFLLKNDHFKLHKDNGYITVEKKKAETEKVAADLKLRDESAPITPSDYAPGGKFASMQEPTVTGGN